MEYIAYLHKDRKSGYGVSFPDFPECISAGETLEEARRMAVQALTFHIKGITEDGEVLPQPSSLDQLAKDPGNEKAPWLSSLPSISLRNRGYDEVSVYCCGGAGEHGSNGVLNLVNRLP